MSEKKNPRGRPTKFSAALAGQICERLANGEPLAAICRDPGMPHPSTVRMWMGKNEAFSSAIARAREDGFDILAAECLSISDTPLPGTKEVEREWGTEVTRADMIEHRRFQVDTRLKLLAKWDPKRFGDKIQADVAHSGDIRVEIADLWQQ